MQVRVIMNDGQIVNYQNVIEFILEPDLSLFSTKKDITIKYYDEKNHKNHSVTYNSDDIKQASYVR